MERIGFVYEPLVSIVLTGVEIVLLRQAALAHYDAKCRGIAEPGIGAWVHGALNKAEWSLDPEGPGATSLEESLHRVRTKNPKLEIQFDLSRLDTVSKVLETASGLDHEEAVVLVNLKRGFKEAAGALRAEAIRINKQPSVLPPWKRQR